MKKVKLNEAIIRQGDVLLVRVDKQDAKEREPAAADGSTVLAFGESTGHKHRFERASEAQALTWRNADNSLYFARPHDYAPSFES